MQAITPRGVEINLDAARPIEAIRVARTLLRTSRVTTLATLDPSGYPYSTVTNLIVEPDGVPAVFMSGLTVHARNITADARVSMTVADTGSDVMTTARLTLSGQAVRVPDAQVPALKARYVERFPKARLYLGLPDALWYRVRGEAVQLNGGPAQNANSVTPEDLLTNLAPASELMDSAPALIASLNEGDRAARLAATAGAEPGRWRVSGIDPEGIDLSTTSNLARLWFTGPVASREDFDTAVADVL
ncbi:pyridoxamine 5'-phosphate oxidase family protein [Anderseniella sp. Alg231-50]|uniref:pyridoxamine 5'-phosphate oxidase family protein n=1 Tax=Anderseniella sp. Alg231-50 TaxID=1922226 RepID=UPI000D5561EE